MADRQKQEHTKHTKHTEHTEHMIYLEIPSELRFIHILDAIVPKIVREMGFDDESAEQINLSVIEAGTNAIKHGNGNDPKKTVNFRFCISDSKITIFVKDHGKGFNPDVIGNPLDPGNLLKPSGRGIFLMKVFMDETEFKVLPGRGTEVKIVKYKPNRQ